MQEDDGVDIEFVQVDIILKKEKIDSLNKFKRNEIEDSGISVLCNPLTKLVNLTKIHFNLQEYIN